MNSLTFRITTAIVTFIIGVSVATAWVLHSHESVIEPVPISEGVSNPNGSALEMVFVLDTTGSMGGLLEGAKQRIWGIVNEVMQAPSHPAVRIGLVAYRDRGDQYVTQVLSLTNDLDKVYSTLMDYQASGGGDTPEECGKLWPMPSAARAGLKPQRTLPRSFSWLAMPHRTTTIKTSPIRLLQLPKPSREE